jgi:hypothetical protein
MGLFRLAAAMPNQASSRSAWMRGRGGGPTRSRAIPTTRCGEEGHRLSTSWREAARVERESGAPRLLHATPVLRRPSKGL